MLGNELVRAFFPPPLPTLGKMSNFVAIDRTRLERRRGMTWGTPDRLPEHVSVFHASGFLLWPLHLCGVFGNRVLGFQDPRALEPLRALEIL